MSHTRALTAVLVSALALLAPAAASAAPGDLDASFSGDGKLTADLGATDTGEAVLYQPDGKVVVAGQTGSGPLADFAILRFNTDGSPDNSFDTDGRVTIPFGPRDEAKALALQPDGSIVVAGNTNADAGPSTGSFSIGVTRIDKDGHIDAAFNHGSGRKIVDFGGQELAEDVLVQPDGKIVVGGQTQVGTNSNFFWARLEDDGDLDNTFDGDGRATLDAGGSENTASIDLGPGGTILTAGSTTANAGGSRDYTVVRLTTGGVPDNSFSQDGRAQVGFGDADDVATGISVLPDGSALVGGRSLELIDGAAAGDFTAARLTPQGELDPSYGDGGRARIPSDSVEVATDATATPDGGLAIVGSTFKSGAFVDFAAGVLRPDGEPDTRFGGGRPVVVDVSGGADLGHAVATRDGRVAIAGNSFTDVEVAQLVLPRPGDPFPPEPTPAEQPSAPTEQPSAPPAEGQPPAMPAGDTTAPIVSNLRLKPTRFRARRGTRGSFALTEPARVTLTVQRRRGRRFVRAGSVKLSGKPGRNTFKLRKLGRRRLASGSYRLIATAVDPAGNASRKVRVGFRVRR